MRSSHSDGVHLAFLHSSLQSDFIPPFLLYDNLTMLFPLFHSSSVVCTLVFIFRFSSASQAFCNAAIYGVPNYRDCLSAWRLMPFAEEPKTSYNARHFELYSEPQYLQPAFSMVFNRYKPLPINQLPKIWRYSTCVLFFPLGSTLGSSCFGVSAH